jgi:hypothetical protein
LNYGTDSIVWMKEDAVYALWCAPGVERIF